jgi:hypothetical protein
MQSEYTYGKHVNLSQIQMSGNTFEKKKSCIPVLWLMADDVLDEDAVRGLALVAGRGASACGSRAFVRRGDRHDVYGIPVGVK